MTNNTAGNKLSAIVEKVSGQADAAGEIAVGHLLLSINGQSTKEMSYTETLNLLKAEQEKRCVLFILLVIYLCSLQPISCATKSYQARFPFKGRGCGG